jgi:hypothetical protein
MSDTLLEELIALETSLHRKSIRNNRSQLEVLLHEDFFEFGSSGKVWLRGETIEALTIEAQDAGITSTDYELHRLAADVAQLTYTSQGADGTKALRSSLWKLTHGQWRMIFHQGTKTHF